MKSDRKITIMLPESLVDKALSASKTSLTATIRQGLELVAASSAYEGLRKYRGKLKLGLNLDKLREDK